MKKVKLRDVVEIVSDSVNPQNAPTTKWRLYSLPGFDAGKTVEIVNGDEIKSNKLLVPDHCILFNKLNVRFRRVWKVGDIYEHKICSTEFLPFVVKSECSADYLYYVLLTDTFTRHLSEVNTNTSGSHKRVDANFILSSEVSLPPLPVQRRIAGVLGAMDEKIAVNRRKTAELEALAKAVYDYWFVQFDFPDAHGRPYRSSGGKMTWNALLKREIPEGWDSCAIGELCNCHDSKRIPLPGKQRSEMQGKIPYYGATGVMDHVNKHIFDGEFLLFAEDGSVMTDNGFPILQIINGKTWVNNHTHVLSPRINCSVKFLQLHFRNIPVRKIKTGSIQPKVTKENLFSFRVLSIPQSVLSIVDGTFKAIQNDIEILEQEVKELTLQRDALLPLLMNGQVEVA